MEDNSNDVFLIDLALKRADIQNKLTVINNGEEAVNYLLKLEAEKWKLPDLILLDVNLPRINGLEVLREIKSFEFSTRIPITILTSSDVIFDFETFDKNGGNVLCIKKPNNISDFKEVICFIKNSFCL